MKISGVTVLYHPKENVIGNIRSYAGELDTLYVLDNTEHPQAGMADRFKGIKNVRYTAFGENLGVAKALNFASGKAVTAGRDWLLTMDQDSAAPKGMVALLKKYTGADVGIVSPRHVTLFDKKGFSGDDISEETVVMTSGNLLNLAAWKKCGPFDERYFIDAVDHEYCLRLKGNGYRVLQANRALLKHGWGEPSVRSFFGRKVIVSNHSPARRYYMTRNTLMMVRDHREEFPDHCAKALRGMTRDVFKAILLEEQKWKKLCYTIKALLDYRSGITGKLKEKP